MLIVVGSTQALFLAAGLEWFTEHLCPNHIIKSSVICKAILSCLYNKTFLEIYHQKSSQAQLFSRIRLNFATLNVYLNFMMMKLACSFTIHPTPSLNSGMLWLFLLPYDDHQWTTQEELLFFLRNTQLLPILKTIKGNSPVIMCSYTLSNKLFASGLMSDGI
jgi:hypothetical protein